MNTGHAYKYQEWAFSHLRTGIQTGQELMFFCVEPDHPNEGSPAAQLNLESGLWHCFSCRAAGNMKKLARLLGERWSEPEVNVEDLRRRLSALKVEHNGNDQLPVLPESTLGRYNFPTKYWTGRGLTEATIKTFDLGYDIMENVASIPIRNQTGGLIGFIKRYLEDNPILKYKYPKGFKRQKELFGSWLLTECRTDTVVICEGSIDAMKVWQAGYPAVAQYGSSISPEQIKLLRRLGFGQAVLFYDADRAGKAAVLAAQGLTAHTRGGKTTWTHDPARDLRRSFLVTVAAYDWDMPSDPGAMTTAEIDRAVLGAEPPRRGKRSS